jgi:hypothetical protein
MAKHKKMNAKEAGKKGGETAAQNQGKGQHKEDRDDRGLGDMRGVEDITQL